MKRQSSICISFLFVLAGFYPVQAIGQNVCWISGYGNSGQNGGLRMVVEGDNSIYVAGRVGPPSLDMDGQGVNVLGASDILLAKLDSTGTAVWATSAGGICLPSDFEQATEIAFCPTSQQVVITGNYSSNASFGPFTLPGGCNGEGDMFVAAYDTSGTCLWANGARSAAMSSNEMIIGPGTDIHVFGSVSGYANFLDTSLSLTPGGYHAVYNSSGELQSAKRIMVNGEVNGADWYGNNLLVCGGYVDNDSLWDVGLNSQVSGRQEGFIAESSTSGSVIWTETISGTDDVYMGACTSTPSGKIIAYGFSYGDVYLPSDTISLPGGQFSGFLVCFDSNHQYLWGIGIESPQFMAVLDLIVGDDQDIYVYGKFSNIIDVGGTVLTSNASKEVYVARLDTLGTVHAALRVGRTHVAGRGSIVKNNHGFYMASTFDSTMVWESGLTLQPSAMNAPDFFVVKLQDISGFTGTRSLEAINRELVIYANPNKGTCTVELPAGLKNSHDVVLSIYSMNGSLMERFPLNTTSNDIRLNLQARAHGLYEIVISDGIVYYYGTVVFQE